jgi:hypothetical protein
VDEKQEELLGYLSPLGVTISRREILSLFDVSCTFLHASSEITDDEAWKAQVKKSDGIVLTRTGSDR